VPDLVALAEDVQRVLALERLEARSGTTCDSASLMLPLMHVGVAERRRSPMPTQLNGAGSCTAAGTAPGALAKYSEASFWKPYVETVAATSAGRPRRREDVVDSNTIDELITTIRSSVPALWAAIAASNVAARIRSFSASRS
jgi:hypothetical protein